MAESEISAVWRSLHNLAAEFGSLVALRDVFARAKATEEQALNMDERLSLVTKQVEDKQSEFAKLRNDMGSIAERYKAREAEFEAKHGERVKQLEAEYVLASNRLQDALSVATKTTNEEMAKVAQNLTVAKAEHVATLAQLAEEQKAAQGVIDQINKTVDARQKQLEAIKANAAKLAGG